MYSFVANDRIRGGLRFTSQNHHCHSLLLHSAIVHIEIFFNCQPRHQYGFLVDSIPLCLIVHPLAHFLFLVVVTSFTFAKLGFKINIFNPPPCFFFFFSLASIFYCSLLHHLALVVPLITNRFFL
jgi:hypothetical protein